MIVTKEQQERIFLKYIHENHNTDECNGFIDGINAALELVDKLYKQRNSDRPGFRLSCLQEVWQAWCELDFPEFDKWLHDQMHSA